MIGLLTSREEIAEERGQLKALVTLICNGLLTLEKVVSSPEFSAEIKAALKDTLDAE